ncbi:MAG: ECF-type sigma factor [Marinicellaceae bacterium]
MNNQITQILSAKVNGRDTLDQVFNLMYPEIKKLANSQLARLNTGQTITPTVLVNECYMKLSKPDNLSFENRKHFICTVAKCMRQFLVDKVRKNMRLKRAAEISQEPITQIMGAQDVDFKLLEIDEILTKLELVDPDMAELAELRFFSGHSLQEIADIKQVSKRTIIRKWNMTKSFIITMSQGNQEKSNNEQ